MQPKIFHKMFSQLSKQMTVSLIAKEQTPIGSCLQVDDELPVFDAVDLFEKNECLTTKSGLIATRHHLMNKPIKTLFYALIIEIEYRLYRFLKQRVQSPKDLQTCNFNELIRMFLADQDVLKLQNIYTKKKELREDLKAIGSFRNVIMHSNRKLDLDTEFITIIKRKRQALRLISALDQLY